MSEEDIRQSVLEAVSELDAEDMLGHLRNFPDDLAAQWAIEQDALRAPSHLLCLGMGGSAAAGDFLASLANHAGDVPVSNHRGYGLPGWVDDGTMVVATSYSGNTEETLDATEQAIARDLSCLMISSGGKLASMGEHIAVPRGQPPRSAFGHLFGALSRIGYSAGIIDGFSDKEEILKRVRDAVEDLDFVNNPDSPTLAIARTLLDREVGIVSAPELSCAGVRFANQLNENGGIFARATALPEMNHNEVIAWTDPAAKESQALLLLTWSGMHERVADRIDWMVDAVEVDVAWNLHCEGDTLLESMLYACVAMDWISCAVAFLRGKNPSAIGAIRDLKEHLSNQ